MKSYDLLILCLTMYFHLLTKMYICINISSNVLNHNFKGYGPSPECVESQKYGQGELVKSTKANHMKLHIHVLYCCVGPVLNFGIHSTLLGLLYVIQKDLL